MGRKLTDVRFIGGHLHGHTESWPMNPTAEHRIDPDGTYFLYSIEFKDHDHSDAVFVYYPDGHVQSAAARSEAVRLSESPVMAGVKIKADVPPRFHVHTVYANPLSFSDRARKVMQLANQEAQRFNHEYIDTEHILLGLVKGGAGIAAMVFSSRRIGLRDIRLKVEEIVHSGPYVFIMGKLPQTPLAKKVIEYAIEEARNLNHNYVGTEHLLLGLIREQEGVAYHVLTSLGLKLEEVREEVIQILHGEDPHPDDIANDLKRIAEEESPVEFVGGLMVSKDTLCFHLIPQIAMQRLCERIALGEQTKGKDAWNALSDNQHVLDSREALARRLGHLINHSYRLLAKIQNKEPWTEEDEKEASAVMWGGMFAICSINRQRKQDA